MTRPAGEPTLFLRASFERSLLAVIAFLCATISVKLASIQVLEIFELIMLFYAAIYVAKNSWRVQTSRALLQLMAGYAVFLAGTTIGALLAFTRPFYLEATGLYRPGYITLARSTELITSGSALIILTIVFRKSRDLCLFTLRIFFMVGSVSSVLSLAAFFALYVLRIGSPFVAGGRASGFLNEGGPYGLYIVSVISAGWVLRSFLSPTGRQLLIAAQVCNVLALLASASKAGISAAVLLLVCQTFLFSGLRQRAVTGLLIGTLVFVVMTATDTWFGIVKYIAGGQDYETLSLLRPEDGNFVIGRVSGLFLVPRMIRAHPWAGVGWGNYGLVRNNVMYRGLSPVIGVTDSPGLGLYGTTAEVGIPLTLLLCWLLLRPVQLVCRLTRWRPLVTLALVQPVAHLCGAQLNLGYPWVVTALALGMAGVHPALSGTSVPHRPHRETFVENGEPSVQHLAL